MNLTDLLVQHVHLLAFGIFALTICGAAVLTLGAEPEVRADVLAALKASNWKLEAAATQIGMSVSRFSLQVNGHEPMTFLARAWKLEGFWAAFAEIHALRSGAEVVKAGELSTVVKELRTLHFQMARMALKAERKAESA